MDAMKFIAPFTVHGALLRNILTLVIKDKGLPIQKEHPVSVDTDPYFTR